MTNEHDKKDSEQLPGSVTEFIGRLLRKMRYRRKVLEDVKAELTSHFTDELADCTEEAQKTERAKQLIADFGDPKLLGILMRRAKKRCRPLWQKAMVRSLHVLGICILYLLVCSIPLLVGKPTLSVDYVEWLNELVRAGREEAENARPYYEKACELNVEMPKWLADNMSSWPSDFNDAGSKLLTDWLDDSRGAVEKLREGARCAGYWANYHTDETRLDKDLVGNAMKILPGYRRLAFTMRWQIRRQADDGNVEAAMSDAIALSKFGSHLQAHGLLIEQLVGIAIEALAHGEIFSILERTAVHSHILNSTYQQLEEQFGRQEAVISLEAEKVFWYDAIQRGFTDDGQGNGRLLARGLPFVVTENLTDNLWNIVSFNFPDREEMVAEIERYYAEFDNVLSATPRRLHDKPADERQTNHRVKIAPVLLKHNTPAYTRVSALTWRVKTDRQALLTVIAALRYEKAKGRYPADLNGLIEAGYLKTLPLDPYSNEPLVYRRTDDNFILYSFGPNLKDDGGISGKGISGKNKQWTDEGDTVFWPLPGH